MKSKTISYKGFKIVEGDDGRYDIFTNEEYSYGKGYRTPEFDVGSIEEAKHFIDCY